MEGMGEGGLSGVPQYRGRKYLFGQVSGLIADIIPRDNGCLPGLDGPQPSHPCKLPPPPPIWQVPHVIGSRCVSPRVKGLEPEPAALTEHCGGGGERGGECLSSATADPQLPCTDFDVFGLEFSILCKLPDAFSAIIRHRPLDGDLSDLI